MTKEQKEMALELGKCRFAPATFDKKFCRDMASRARADEKYVLSEKQDELLKKMHHRYRKQIALIKEKELRD